MASLVLSSTWYYSLWTSGPHSRRPFLKIGVRREFSVDNSRRDVCNRGCDPSIGLDGVSPMPTIPQRIASAFAVLCGQSGDLTEMANDREQSRQSLDREAERVADAVDGTAARDRIDQLQRPLADQHAEVQALRDRLRHAA